MNGKLNIAEILKGCPSGMELDFALCDNAQFKGIEDGSLYPIEIRTPEGDIALSKYGCCSSSNHSKCVIFPKGKTTWEGFQRPFKDGDVITWEGRGSLVACIYKERKDTATFNHHFALYKGGLGIVVNGEIALTYDELCFATEEEKQKLFDAIKANGYKWNPETKTLEKLIEPKFKVGDRIKLNNSRLICTITDLLKDRYRATADSHDLYEIEFERQDAYKLVPNKFDITTLKPFDKVLVRGNVGQKWIIDFFGFMDKDKGCPFVCVGHYISQCIPYEQNKHLLNTTDDCDDYFKTWE